jgi:hypothetical protein
MHRNHTWMHEHYPLVGLRYVGAAVLLILMLAVLSKPLFASAKKRAPVLLAELRRRGWTELDIDQRVTPYMP